MVSDGKGDNQTAQVANESWQMPVRFFEVEKSQQGVARNLGVKEAKGETILFIGDDIFLEPDACALHMAAHVAHSHAAVLGFTTWDRRLAVNDVMRWLETSGWQFGYGMLRRGVVPRDLQHRFTYTSHVSVPKAVVLAHPFREDMTMYGWEDVEWGSRLAKAGIPLVYEPKAKALHHHMTTLEDSLKRMHTLGVSAVKMNQLCPHLHLVPQGLKKWILQIASFMPTMRGKHTRAFLQGIAESARRQ